MIEMEVALIVTQNEIRGMDESEVENYLEQKIADKFTEHIKKHLDDMSFLEIDPRDNGDMDITAELVLCSKQHIVTGIERMSVKMAQYGLTDEMILDVLSTSIENTGGF